MTPPSTDAGVTTARVLERFQSLADPNEPLTAPEVAADLDCARRTAYDKLQALADSGDLATKKTGARGRVWWRPASTVPGEEGSGEAAAAGESRAFATLVEAVSEYAIFRLDADGRVVTWNEGARRMKGYTREEIVGSHLSTFYAAADRERGVPEANLRIAAERGSCEDEGWRRRADGTRFWAAISITAIYDDDGEVAGYLKVTRDMTDRRERERSLREEYSLVDQLLETSPIALGVVDGDGNVTRANARTEELFGLTRSELEGQHYDDPEWNLYDEDGRPLPPADNPVTRVLETGDPVHGFVHGIQLPDGTERWLSTSAAPVLDDEGDLERVIVALEDVTEVKEKERQIRRQRESLRYLNRVNEVIRGIDRAIVAADSRNEIERAVCDRIAESTEYRFAMIGEYSADFAEFTPRASAGIGEEYLAAVLDGEDTPPVSEGLAATAVRTGDVQVATDLSEFRFGHWQDAAREQGFRSFAAIPLAYGTVVYGVLGVYSGQTDAFDTEEREILAELGETVAHAINAIERKRALLSDSVFELSFREDGELARLFDENTADGDVTVRIDRTVLLEEEGDALQYFAVESSDPEQFAAGLAERESVTDVRVMDATGPTTELEVRSAGPTLAGVLAGYGGRVTRLVYDGDAVRVTAEVPYGMDVRQVVEAAQDLYPDLALQSKTAGTPDRWTGPDLQYRVAEDLTARQETALETGYYGGFFEWPRASTGEELAESLGVSPSTFHKHLRVGERKVLRTLFEGAE
jgi:PAS domain S-box-containing protein